MARILIMDYDPVFCEALGAILSGLGHHAEHAQTLETAAASGAARRADVIFLNAAMPDGSGLDVLPHLRALPARPEVILITDSATADGAERAIRNGAWDYVAKQGGADRMVLPLIRALEYRDRKPHKREELHLKRDAIIGNGPGITRCLDIVAEAAASDASALLYGETGVGKEVFARAIHDNSQRHGGPFVAVDCASLSRTLAGSILFGHRKGAFTGADKDRDGLVAQAHRGTLFLDEVGELPLAMQKIFLRVLQEHRFRPVGGRTETTSDFRLICATNRDIEEMVSRGTFRSDLLFRIRTVVMRIPPLRERVEDIPALADHYIRRLCGKYGMSMKGLSTDLNAALGAYHWPGNVRELIHTLERAVLAAQDDSKIFARHLPDHLRISIARQAATSEDTPAQPRGTSHTAWGGRNALPPVPSPKDTAPVPAAWDIPGSGNAMRPSAVSPVWPRDIPVTAADTFTPPLRPGASCVIHESTRTALDAARDQDTARVFSAAAVSGISGVSVADPVSSSSPPHTDQADTPSPDKISAIPDKARAFVSGITDTRVPATDILPFNTFRDRVFRDYLTELMEESDYNIPVACTLSGLSRSYLYDLLKRYEIPSSRKGKGS